MTLIWFTLLLWLASLTAGFLGALTGLGGGVVLIPLMALAFGVDLRYAIGASLVSIIAVSSSSAVTYLPRGLANLRMGMVLETATALGAIGGAFLAAFISTRWLSIVFGVVLLVVVYVTTFAFGPNKDQGSERCGFAFLAPAKDPLRLGGTYVDCGQVITYRPQRIGWGASCMLGAGVISGLLGIGAGAFKVLAMDHIMRMPFKVSTTTSNFIMGVTAAASASIYFARGYVDPHIALPVLLGTLPGTLLASRLLTRMRTQTLRIVFACLVTVAAVRMIWGGIGSG